MKYSVKHGEGVKIYATRAKSVLVNTTVRNCAPLLTTGGSPGEAGHVLVNMGPGPVGGAWFHWANSRDSPGHTGQSVCSGQWTRNAS